MAGIFNTFNEFKGTAGSFQQMFIVIRFNDNQIGIHKFFTQTIFRAAEIGGDGKFFFFEMNIETKTSTRGIVRHLKSFNIKIVYFKGNPIKCLKRLCVFNLETF